MSRPTSKPVASVQKTPGQELRFSVDEYNARHFVSIRVFVRARGTDKMVATKSGVTFKLDLIHDVRAALDAVAAAITRGVR